MLIRYLPADSALMREISGPMADWDLRTQLLAVVANETRVANWAQTKDAHARPPRNYPTPITPPGMAPNEHTTGPEVTDNTPAGVKKFGTAQMTLAESNEWLGW